MARVVKALGVKEVEKISKMPGVHAVGGVPGLALRVWASAAGSGCAWILRTECNKGDCWHLSGDGVARGAGEGGGV